MATKLALLIKDISRPTERFPATAWIQESYKLTGA